jgi:uncharacterized membrane protein
MDIKEEEEIKKEFQLERVVLFSDAVFAIIITIMVLELKVPEGLRHASHEKVQEAFIELIPKLVAYIFAFFITGMFWAKHLKLFSYLKDYTKQLIVYNLIFLFFITLFPFGVSVMAETLSPKNYEGFYVYLTVVMMALFAHTLLTGYLVRNAQQLCIKPNDVKINLEWKAQQFNFIALPLVFIYTIAGLHYKFNQQLFAFGFALWGMMFGLVRRKLNPNPQKDGPLLARLFKSRKRKPAKVKVAAPKPAD